MAFSTPYTFTALELLTAAKLNAIQENIAEIWKGTTAGDTDFYTSATAKARLALGTEYQFLQVNSGATAPQWGGLHKALVYHNTTQSVDSGSATALVFNSEYEDAPGWHSTVSNTSRMTVTKPGVYVGACIVQYAGVGGTGSYWDTISLRIDGVFSIDDRRRQEVDANTKRFAVTFPPYPIVSAGSYLEIVLEQNSGGTRTVLSEALFALTRIG